MSVDICYVISSGLSVRMILHSEIIPHLHALNRSVLLAVPNGARGDVLPLADALGVRVEEYTAPRLEGSRGFSWWRRYLSDDVRSNAVLWSHHRERCRPIWRNPRHWARSASLYSASRAASRWPALRSFYAARMRDRLRSASADALIDRFRPRVVVSPLPAHPPEACLLDHAQRFGSVTVGQILSWDNVTAKGRFLVPPKFYLSWGPIMTAELHERYVIRDDRVRECGVAHFDAHRHDVSREATAAHLVRLGLHADRPYLFFGMSLRQYAPCELEIVESLARAVNDDRFGARVQLVVRPHPRTLQVDRVGDPEWQARLARVAGPRVAVDYPSMLSGALGRNFAREDLSCLVNLLAGCSVCLNSGSTVSLEAIIHDKPVVLTPFDTIPDLPWHRSARRVMEFPHLARLATLGGLRIARSLAETVQQVQAYLHDPGRDAEGRGAVREQECGPCDGQASRRIALALSEFVEIPR